MKFRAIVKEVRSKSLVSGDKSYRVLLESIDEAALSAGAIPGTTEVEVELTPAN